MSISVIVLLNQCSLSNSIQHVEHMAAFVSDADAQNEVNPVSLLDVVLLKKNSKLNGEKHSI